MNALAESGAVFNDKRDRRFLLWRSREDGAGIISFTLLNPSTADEIKNDPTVLRCWIRSQEMGFKTMLLTNIFSYRSTDPKGIVIEEAAELLENIVTIRRSAIRADLVVCAWGIHGQLDRRGHQILGMMRQDRIPVHVFGMTKSGEPRHPLYLPYNLKPTPLDWDSLRIDGGFVQYKNKEEEA
jgi:hypothetical protein